MRFVQERACCPVTVMEARLGSVDRPDVVLFLTWLTNLSDAHFPPTACQRQSSFDSEGLLRSSIEEFAHLPYQNVSREGFLKKCIRPAWQAQLNHLAIGVSRDVGQHGFRPDSRGAFGKYGTAERRHHAFRDRQRKGSCGIRCDADGFAWGTGVARITSTRSPVECRCA